VLVVDADPGVHRLVSALLSPEGIEVEAVRTGEQALRMAADRDFDLVIAEAGTTAGASELFVHALAAAREFDLVIADAGTTASASELFVHALGAAAPAAVVRLVLTYAGETEPPDPLPGRSVFRARKPLNVRELHGLASRVLASSPPRSPASRAAG
jgi:hypothetical protein